MQLVQLHLEVWHTHTPPQIMYLLLDMQLVQLHLEVWHTHHLKCNPTTRYAAAEGKYIYIHLTALCSCTKKYGTQLSLSLLYAACAAAPRNSTNPTQKYPYYSTCSLCSCTKKYGIQYWLLLMRIMHLLLLYAACAAAPRSMAHTPPQM
jgi:hypothetical protein